MRIMCKKCNSYNINSAYRCTDCGENNQQDLDPKIIKIVDDNFFELLL